MRELWSERDEASLFAFLAAVEADDLTAALFNLDGSSSGVQDSGEALLAEWAGRVQARRPAGGAARENARALASVLGHEAGFSGDAEDYYHPRNCLLHEVLARRRGMPILLSAVWIEVGRRAGIPVDGIGLPGHFIVRVGPDPGALADPFSAGAILTLADCKKKVEEVAAGRLAWRPEFLHRSPTPATLERILHNLAGCYARAGDEAGRFRALTFLSALRPDEPENLFSRAESADALGVKDLAMRVYGEILERFPDSAQALAVADRLTSGGEEPVN